MIYDVHHFTLYTFVVLYTFTEIKITLGEQIIMKKVIFFF